MSISTTIPENTHHFRVYCNLRYASGTAWFDCLQLEEGNAVNDFNALQNADFSNNDAWFTNEDNAISAQNGTVTLNGVAGLYNDAVEETTEAQETTVEATEPATTVVEVTEPAEFGNITATDAYGNITTNERGQITRTVRKTYLVDSGTTEPVTTETTESTSGGETEDETDALGNKYIYQNVDVNRKGICFNIVGEAQAKSVPLSNKTRTFGIALNIYYDGVNAPETHYQEFNSNTDKKQTVSLSVCPNDDSKVIDHVAFAFVYGYNKKTMTAYSAMLNIASTAASDESGTSSGEGEPSSTNGGENEPDDFIDYEVVSETLDTSQEYIDYNEDYTDAIRLKGNFINSLSYFSNLMDSIGNVKKLRFNPSISDKDYILLYYKMDDLILEGSDPINALSSSTHQRMYGSPTPLSKVIYFKYDILNLRYHLTENNCMQMMAKLLQLGRFSGSEFYDNVMRNVILCEMQGVFTPKFAYEQLNTIICYSDFGYTTQGLYIAHTSLLSACMLNSGVKIALNNYYTKLLYYILLTIFQESIIR